MGDKKDRDRRRHARAAALLMIEYPDEKAFSADYLTDFSEGGLFIRTRLPFPIGTHLSFSISFPGLLAPIPLSGIVRRVVSQGLDEEVGVGVEFELADADSQAAVRWLAETVLAPGGLSPKNRPPYRILLADADQVMLELFAHAFNRFEGSHNAAALMTATTGVQALQLLEGQEFDLVVLSSRLPDVEATDLVHSMRSKPGFARVPVILAGVAAEKLTPALLTCGANLVIPGDLEPRTLLRTLSTLLDKK